MNKNKFIDDLGWQAEGIRLKKAGGYDISFN